MMINPLTPLGFALMLLQDRRSRLAQTKDLGASAIEWVVISAILAAIAIGIGVILRNALTDKASSIDLGAGV